MNVLFGRCAEGTMNERKKVTNMIQMVAGIVLGVMMSAVAALVAGCIYLEHKYPEIQDRLRYEIGGGEE